MAFLSSSLDAAWYEDKLRNKQRHHWETPLLPQGQRLLVKNVSRQNAFVFSAPQKNQSRFTSLIPPQERAIAFAYNRLYSRLNQSLLGSDGLLLKVKLPGSSK